MRARNVILTALMFAGGTAANAQDPGAPPACVEVRRENVVRPNTVCLPMPGATAASDSATQLRITTGRVGASAIDSVSRAPILPADAGVINRKIEDLREQARRLAGQRNDRQRAMDADFQAFLQAQERQREAALRAEEPARRPTAEAEVAERSATARQLHGVEDSPVRPPSPRLGEPVDSVRQELASATPNVGARRAETYDDLRSVRVPTREGVYPAAEYAQALDSAARRLADLAERLHALSVQARLRDLSPQIQAAIWDSLSDVLRQLDQVRRDAAGEGR